jgi:hypothetical protein
MNPWYFLDFPNAFPGAFVILIALVVIWFWRRSDFVVRIRGDQVDFHGKFPASRRAGLAQFVRYDLHLAGPITIRGAWYGRRLRLWFSGPLTPGEQQRLRNYLLTRL